VTRSELARGRGGLRAGVVLAAALLPLGGPLAHDFAITDVLVVLKTDGTYLVELTVDVDALALGVSPLTDSAEVAAALEAMSPAELEIASERARETILRRIHLRFDGESQRPDIEFPGAEVSAAAATAPPTVLGTTARLSGRVPAGAARFRFGASRAFNAVQLTILDQASLGGARYVLGAGEDSPEFTLGRSVEPPRRLDVAGRYLVLGFEHILPLGVDHILFVLGLYLLSPRLRPLLWQISAFTVAHTASLALSMGGVVSLPSRLVEPLIALSVAYVAVENTFTSELKPWRPLLVFGFGLLHGLGFAGALREIGLPEGEFASALLAFNAGVELGQISVVALAWVAVGWLHGRSWYRSRVVVPLSLGIAGVGLYWAVGRAVGMS
jgi:hypothetical protein